MKNLKNIGVGLLIALGFVATWTHGSHVIAPTVAQKPLGDATVSNYPTAYTNGLSLGNNPTTLENEYTLTVGTGSNQAVMQNTTGATFWVDTPELVLTGTTTTATPYASSTMNFYVGTTSAATITNNFVRTGGFNLIDGSQVATGTRAFIVITATTTNSGQKGVIPVQPNEYLFVQNQAPLSSCSGAAGACEVATSTARGFNYFLKFHIYQ